MGFVVDENLDFSMDEEWDSSRVEKSAVWV